jgi:hypothetical protein
LYLQENPFCDDEAEVDEEEDDDEMELRLHLSSDEDDNEKDNNDGDDEDDDDAEGIYVRQKKIHVFQLTLPTLIFCAYPKVFLVIFS